MDWLKDVHFETTFYHNSVRDWLIALGIAALTALVAWAIRALVQRRLEHSAVAQKSRALRIFARAVHKTKWFFYLMLAVFLGAKFLELPKNVNDWIRTITVVAVLVQVGVWVSSAIRHSVEHIQEQHEHVGTGAAPMALAIGFLGRLVVWMLVFLPVLNNLGIQITTLIAGLGIGGVAAALAVQNVFGDLIASLTIYFDRPFDVGDFIIVGSEPGTVKRVGVRSTRVQSLWGQEIVFANSELIKNPINNYKRMKERRIQFEFGVVYETPMAQVEKIPQMVREIVDADNRMRFDRAHFLSYGDYALVFQVVYYVLSPEYNVYMDVQQHINLELGRRFEKLGIEFAYPTYTLKGDMLVGPNRPESQERQR